MAKLKKKSAKKEEEKEEASLLTSEMLFDEVQKKAYQLYEERGWLNGNDLNDWFKAENAILKEK
ncbi:DUF2934 domain-containing protein [bacterium]|nr:DUF2934 domain-containing protein [bacterium]MBU1153575.1 DUF2934 domain-containing protein [bacterium]MBU2599318.1 DUF2934 domain-containing protein [bacterium]